MTLKQLIFPSLAGTSAMTLFSYGVSEALGKWYKEPEILATLMRAWMPGIHSFPAQLSGWMIHYAIGILFVAVARTTFFRTSTDTTCYMGGIFGFVCGLAGIIGWNIVYMLGARPLPDERWGYSGHLMLAHIVFGMITALTVKFFHRTALRKVSRT